MPLESPLAYSMYLFNLWIAHHVLIKIDFNFFVFTSIKQVSSVLHCTPCLFEDHHIMTRQVFFQYKTFWINKFMCSSIHDYKFDLFLIY